MFDQDPEDHRLEPSQQKDRNLANGYLQYTWTHSSWILNYKIILLKVLLGKWTLNNHKLKAMNNLKSRLYNFLNKLISDKKYQERVKLCRLFPDQPPPPSPIQIIYSYLNTHPNLKVTKNIRSWLTHPYLDFPVRGSKHITFRTSPVLFFCCILQNKVSPVCKI